MKQRISPTTQACLIYVALHLAAHFSARFFHVAPGISIWYAPSGLALALLVMLGPRMAPVVLAANLLTAVLPSPGSAGLWQFLFPLLITLNHTAFAMLARRLVGPVFLPGSLRDTLFFILIVLTAPASSAITGCLLSSLVGNSFGSLSEFLRLFLYWWVGDLSGILTVLPVAISFGAPAIVQGCHLPAPHLPSRKAMPAILLEALVIAGSLSLVFAIDALRSANAFYLCFLPLLWICLRHGLAGATLSTLTITMGGLVGMHLTGSDQSLITNFLLFQMAAAAMGLGLGISVSRRNQAEGDRERLLKVIEATTDFVATTSREGHLLYANAALLRQLDLQELPERQSTSLTAYVSPKQRGMLEAEAIPAALRAGTWHGEASLCGKDGKEVPVSIVLLSRHETPSDEPVLSFVMRDITRQKQAEAERIENERKMLQLQKLESLGVLAGGIAHDFNNLLTVMLGHASLARLELPEGSQVQSSLMQIEKAATSAAELCQQMLAYAGRSPLAFTYLSPTMLIEETMHLLRVSVGRKQRIELKLSQHPDLIYGDASQIRQVLMNLVLNAAEAIGDNEGLITLSSRREQLDSVELVRDYNSPALKAGPYVILEVEDNGSGMSTEVLSRIFEPFYTTKFTGHGLGLAAVLGIMRSHMAGIHVTSIPGRGTRFRLAFPCVPEPSRPKPPAEEGVGREWKGSGLVLVVDDDDGVRGVVCQSLHRMGYETFQAGDGLEGVEMFRKHKDRLQLVLLDLTMPQMDGEECFHRMHDLEPGIPIILMSGFSEKLSLDRFNGARPAAFMAKPVNHRNLGACLRRLSYSAE